MPPLLELDDLDRALIALLEQNARLTNRELAAQLESSEATIRRRVDRLISSDRMKIVAVSSPFVLGYTVMAIIGLQIDRRQQHTIEAELLRTAEIRFVGLTIGSYDAILEAWFKNNEALLEFLTNRLGQIPGIQRIETWQVLKLSKYNYDWGQQPD